jgi:hypothetical protein
MTLQSSASPRPLHSPSTPGRGVAGQPDVDPSAELVRRRATWITATIGFVALVATLVLFGPEALPDLISDY